MNTERPDVLIPATVVAYPRVGVDALWGSTSLPWWLPVSREQARRAEIIGLGAPIDTLSQRLRRRRFAVDAAVVLRVWPNGSPFPREA